MTRVDVCILVLALVIGIGLYAITQINMNTALAAVVIEQDGNAIFTRALSQIHGKYEFTFDGGKGVIEADGQRVRIVPMPLDLCPNAICSSMGWISNSLGAIVCLPNRLIVRLIDGKPGDVDILSY